MTDTAGEGKYGGDGCSTARTKEGSGMESNNPAVAWAESTAGRGKVLEGGMGRGAKVLALIGVK